MVKITIIGVGKIKERFLSEGIEEYKKRLGKYCKVIIEEVNDLKIPANENIDEKIKKIEGDSLLSKIGEEEYVFLLDLEGKSLDSVEFSNNIEDLINNGRGKITFLIGGSLGVSESVKKRANSIISFSKMTFTHQMMRMILLEQIYRAFKIISNEKYHK